MKNVFAILLLCFILQSISAPIDIKDSPIQGMMRKLQGTDEPDDIIPNTFPSDLPKEAENTTAPPETFTGDFELPPTIPTTSLNNTENTNDSAALQVTKFHEFKKSNRKIKFGVFIFYLNKHIVETIIMRLSIKYNTRRQIRNLDEQITGESTATTCVIKSDFKNKVGTNGDGENVDYECTAQTSADVDKIETVVIDPTKPMIVGNEAVPFDEVEFTEDSKDGTQNIQNISSAPSGILDDTTASMVDNKLVIKGVLKPSDSLTKNQKFDMDMFDISSNDMKTVSCEVKEIVANSGSCTIECDTVKTPLNTNLGNLTLAKSTNPEKLYLTINTDKSKNQNEPLNSYPVNNESKAFYKKSSSGLSGGAIAGIIIACVAVLVIASILAIILRKPKPPIDTSTTVIGLQNSENI